MADNSEIVERLESIDGVRDVSEEKIDDGFEFHVKIGTYVSRDTIEAAVSEKTGLYNAGSYKTDNDALILKFYTP